VAVKVETDVTARRRDCWLTILRREVAIDMPADRPGASRGQVKRIRKL
jgi:hypothetical protein